MIEVFKFKVGSDYGSGLMGELVSAFLSHQYVSFESDFGKEGGILQITCRHRSSCDDEGTNIHEV